MLNLSQTKLVGLTMELELKAREYKKLCDKLEQLKESNIDQNDEKLIDLRELFKKNNEEIVEINKQLRELKETEELKEKQMLEQYDTVNLFKRKSNTSVSDEEKNMNLVVVDSNKNIIQRLIEKIKRIFSRRNK